MVSQSVRRVLTMLMMQPGGHKELLCICRWRSEAGVTWRRHSLGKFCWLKCVSWKWRCSTLIRKACKVLSEERVWELVQSSMLVGCWGSDGQCPEHWMVGSRIKTQKDSWQLTLQKRWRCFSDLPPPPISRTGNLFRQWVWNSAKDAPSPGARLAPAACTTFQCWIWACLFLTCPCCLPPGIPVYLLFPTMRPWIQLTCCQPCLPLTIHLCLPPDKPDRLLYLTEDAKLSYLANASCSTLWLFIKLCWTLRLSCIWVPVQDKLIFSLRDGEHFGRRKRKMWSDFQRGVETGSDSGLGG